jgi:hypothetical protein
MGEKKKFILTNDWQQKERYAKEEVHSHQIFNVLVHGLEVDPGSELQLSGTRKEVVDLKKHRNLKTREKT